MGVRNPSQAHTPFGLFPHQSSELLTRRLLKNVQLYLSLGRVRTLGGQEALFLEEASYGAAEVIAGLCTSGPWDPAPLQDSRVKPSGITDQLANMAGSSRESFPVRAAEVLPASPGTVSR